VEHRWGQRRAVHQFVHVCSLGGLAAQGHITSVSISGAFVATPLPAALFSVVQVAFVATRGRAHVTAALAAQVVRKTAEGLGLEWCEHAPDIVYALGAAPTSLYPVESTKSLRERPK
jgi:hypothetical protein